jgi:hypothetical protein
LEVNKVAGNFHFAPGKSFQQSGVHVHDLLAFQKESFNVRHDMIFAHIGDFFFQFYCIYFIKIITNGQVSLWGWRVSKEVGWWEWWCVWGMMNIKWEFRGWYWVISYLRGGALNFDSMTYFLPFARRFISFTVSFLFYKGVIF